MIGKPFPQSYWVREHLLCAGCYPGSPDPSERDAKLRGLLDCGIRCVLSLMEVGETSRGDRPFKPYVPRLMELAAECGASVDCCCLPIQDARAPAQPQMEHIIGKIHELVDARIPTYLHCWGGHGRTSTVIACFLIQQGSSPSQAIEQLKQWRAGLPKNHYPFEGDQEEFVLSWSSYA